MFIACIVIEVVLLITNLVYSVIIAVRNWRKNKALKTKKKPIIAYNWEQDNTQDGPLPGKDTKKIKGPKRRQSTRNKDKKSKKN